MSCLALLIVNPADAQSTPVVPVPQFTVSFAGNTYYVPTKVTADPYTEANVTQKGYYVTDGSLRVQIKNQPLRGLDGNVYLNIRYKGHYQNDSWTYPYYYKDMYGYLFDCFTVDAPNGLSPNVVDYTTATFPADSYAPNSQIDFQVQALLYRTQSTLQMVPHSTSGSTYLPALVLNATGDWSDIQTVTIPAAATPTPTASTASNSPTPTASTNMTSESFLLLTNAVSLIVIAVLLAVIAVLLRRRHQKVQTRNNDRSFKRAV
jgi:hypothetical protein